MERYERRNYGHHQGGNHHRTHYILDGQEHALDLQRTVQGRDSHLLRLVETVPLGNGALQGLAVPPGGYGVGFCDSLGKRLHILLLQAVLDVAEKGYGYDRGQDRTAVDEEKCVGEHQLGLQVLHHIKAEGYEQHHHPEAAQDHRHDEHLVPGRRGHSEIQYREIYEIAEHPGRNQITEPPSLPPEPPETDESPEDVSRQLPDIKGIGVQAVHSQDIDQEPGIQGAARCHEHYEKHEDIPYRGFPVLEDGRADVELLLGRVGHLPQEHAQKQRCDDAAGCNHR